MRKDLANGCKLEISREEFVDLIERARLTDTQSRYLRLYLGVDGYQYSMREITRSTNYSHQAVSDALSEAKRRIATVYSVIPWVRPPHKATRNIPPRNIKGVMTVKKAQRIIGGPVEVGERVNGYVRVACYDAYGEVLNETARNVPAALQALINANLGRSRQFCFERDGYRCTNCGGFKNLQADHIHMRSSGRCDRPENLRTLCDGCHGIRHRMRGF